MLKVLDVDGAVKRVDGGWIATGQQWYHDSERYARISAARESEQQAMLAYVQWQGCRLEYLRRCLDDPLASPCGRCDRCTGTALSRSVSSKTLKELRAFLGRVGIRVPPRTQWPTGLPMFRIPLSGRIKSDELADTGRVIARLTDLGWGEELRDIFEPGVDSPLPPKVRALAQKVLADWKEEAQFTACGVVSVGSNRRPLLVAGLSHCVAELLSLPFLGSFEPVEVPESTKANSARRVAALYGRMKADDAMAQAVKARCQGGSIILVDDLIESGWTLTLAARSLRQLGVRSVFPLALASTGRRG